MGAEDIQIKKRNLIKKGTGDKVNTHKKYLIKPFLSTSSEVCVFYGPSAVGKTFFILDMALSVASGQTSWKGYKIPKQKKVVYLAKEGEEGITERKEAWLRENKIDESVIEDYFFVGDNEGIQSFLFDSDDNVNELANDIIEKAGKDVGIVLIDTLSLFFGGDDENNNTQIKDFLQYCKKLAIALKCKVIVIHHTRKDETIFRGAYTIFANSSLVVFIRKCEGYKEAFIEKNKEGEQEITLLKFKLIKVPVGIDDDGDEMVSCVIRKLSEEEEKEEEKKKEDTTEIIEFMEDIRYGRIPVHAIEKEDMHRMYYIVKDEWDKYLMEYEKLTPTKAYNETNPKQKRRARRLCSNRHLFPVQDKKERYKWFILGTPQSGKVWEIPNNWKSSPAEQDYVTAKGEPFANRISLEKEPIDVTAELAKKGYDLGKPIKETGFETIGKTALAEDEIRSTGEPIEGSLFNN